jgi:type IV secretion system protein VirB2
MNQGMKTTTTFVLALLACSVAYAGAGATARVEGVMDNIVEILQAIGVAVFTIAIMFAGYRIIFQGARFADVSNIIIGGILVGGAAVFAGWLMGAA